jgi:hypothetical protein
VLVSGAEGPLGQQVVQRLLVEVRGRESGPLLELSCAGSGQGRRADLWAGFVEVSRVMELAT